LRPPVFSASVLADRRFETGFVLRNALTVV
jgi:hypothetical protein